MKHNFKGKLILSNAYIIKMDYGIVNNSTSNVTFNSITDILNEVYISPFPSKQIKMIIKKQDGERISLEGILKFKKDDVYNIFGWHIDDFALSNELFDLVDEQVEVFIDDYLQKDLEDVIYARKNS